MSKNLAAVLEARRELVKVMAAEARSLPVTLGDVKLLIGRHMSEVSRLEGELSIERAWGDELMTLKHELMAKSAVP